MHRPPNPNNYRRYHRPDVEQTEAQQPDRAEPTAVMTRFRVNDPQRVPMATANPQVGPSNHLQQFPVGQSNQAFTPQVERPNRGLLPQPLTSAIRVVPHASQSAYEGMSQVGQANYVRQPQVGQYQRINGPQIGRPNPVRPCQALPNAIQFIQFNPQVGYPLQARHDQYQPQLGMSSRAHLGHPQFGYPHHAQRAPVLPGGVHMVQNLQQAVLRAPPTEQPGFVQLYPHVGAAQQRPLVSTQVGIPNPPASAPPNVEQFVHNEPPHLRRPLSLSGVLQGFVLPQRTLEQENTPPAGQLASQVNAGMQAPVDRSPLARVRENSNEFGSPSEFQETDQNANPEVEKNSPPVSEPGEFVTICFDSCSELSKPHFFAPSLRSPARA